MRCPISLRVAAIAGFLLLPSRAPAQIILDPVDPLYELPGSTSTATRFETDTGDGSGMFAPAIVGSSTDASGVLRALIWSNGDFDAAGEVLPPLAPAMDSWATTASYDAGSGMNYVAGTSIDMLARKRPVIWSRADAESVYGAPMILSTLGGGEGEVNVMLPYDADLSTIKLAGSSTDMSSVDKAVVWSGPPSGPFAIVPLPHYDPSSAGKVEGYDYDGTDRYVCGWATDTGDTIAQVWKSSDGGTMWTRTALPLLAGGSKSWATHIWRMDTEILQIVGTSEVAGGNRHATLWSTSDGGQGWIPTDLGTANSLPNSEGYVGGIAGDLLVGGRSYGAPGTEVATLWQSDGVISLPYDLNSLVPSSTLVLRSVTGIGVDAMGGLVGVCGVGTDPLPGPARSAAVGPHAYVALASPSTGVEVAEGVGAERVEVIASPNPFSGGTTVSFALPAAASVRLTVHDVAGRRIATLADGERGRGRQVASWDGRDAAGRSVAAGVYLIRLEVAGDARTKKVVRVR